MGYSQSQVVHWFAEGKTDKNASNLFSRGNALYSYGTHFPLAIRHSAETSLKHGDKDWYLLNGDRRSSTTSGHQNHTFDVFREHPRVSFEAIRSAGIDPFSEDLILVDFQQDYMQANFILENGKAARYGNNNVSREKFMAKRIFGSIYSESKCNYAIENGKPVIRQTIHRIGGALFNYQGECYLCAMDEGSYFVAQLPAHVRSIDEAVESLKPALVKKYEKDLAIKRQGEWFFIPTELQDKKEFILAYHFRLPRPLDDRGLERGNIHQCAAGLPIIVEGESVQLCRGMVKHLSSWGGNRRTGEHRPLKLGQQLFIAVRNTEKASWSAAGRVD
jgi:hypothetical protein